MADEPFDNETAPALRQMAETAQREAAEARAQLLALQRKDAFRDAGLDFGNPLHEAVAKAYDGELDAAQVKAYVDGMGLTAAPPPPPDPTPNDAAAFDRLREGTAGQQAPPVGQADREYLQELDRRMDAASRAGNIQELDRLAMEWDRIRPTPAVPSEHLNV